MKILHNSSPRLSKNSKNSGFTLMELLISSFMGILVIGAVGYGLTNILRGNRSNTVQTNKRTEFNRATSFISDEMRRANHIDVNPLAAYNQALSELSSNTPPVTAPPNAQPILALNIPNVRRTPAGNERPIIYLVSDPASGDASVWDGPKVIYRIGPPSDGNGNFTAGAWTLEPLVDGISANAATPSCDPGWTASPSTGALGFYACIQPIATTNDPETAYDDTQQGETAKLFAIGQLDPNNPSSTDYEASTQVFARAEEENLDGSNPDVAYTGACVLNPSGALVCSGGGSRNFSIERLSNAFACRPDGTKWQVLVSAYFINNDGDEEYFDLVGSTTGATSENVDLSNTSLAFSTTEAPLFRVTPVTPLTESSLPSNAVSSNCDSSTHSDVFPSGIQNQEPVSSADTETKFEQLEDADNIPDNLKNEAYIVTDINDPNKVQKSVKDVLNEENLIDPTQPDKVNTGRDYILAFEIGQDSKFIDETANPPVLNPGYDFQDQILKINVE